MSTQIHVTWNIFSLGGECTLILHWVLIVYKITRKTINLFIFRLNQSNHTFMTVNSSYVDGTQMYTINPITAQYIHPPHHGLTKVNAIVANGRLISPSFHINHPSHYWDMDISHFNLETLRFRSWVWPKGKVTQSARYLIDSLPLRFTHQPERYFLIWSYFEIRTWKIQGQGHELGNRSRSQISPSIQSMDFLFVSHPPDQPSPSYRQ